MEFFFLIFEVFFILIFFSKCPISKPVLDKTKDKKGIQIDERPLLRNQYVLKYKVHLGHNGDFLEN